MKNSLDDLQKMVICFQISFMITEYSLAIKYYIILSIPLAQRVVITNTYALVLTIQNDNVFISIRYIWKKLGGQSKHKLKKRLAKIKLEIKSVTDEIKYLSIFRDNGLKFSLYESVAEKKFS